VTTSNSKPQNPAKSFLPSLLVVLVVATAAAAQTPAEERVEDSVESTTEAVKDAGRYLVDTGPLRIRDQFLLGMGFLAFDPVSADIVAPGQWQFDVILTVSNDFAHSRSVEELLDEREGREPLTLEQLRVLDAADPQQGIYMIDGEHYRTAIAVRRGIRENLHLELVVPVISFKGGSLDSTIESFHDAFSLEQSGRLGVPRNDFGVYVGNDGLEVFEDEDPGWSLGDIVLGAKWGILPGDDERSFELALEGLIKLPTGDEERFTSSGSTDFGAQLLATKYFGKSCIHSSLGLAYLGDYDRLGISSQLQVSGMIAYERGFGSKTSLLAQATVSQSPFGDLDLEKLDVISTQITLGAKRVIGQQVLFIGITENVANFDNSADIGFHVGLTRIF
jgi:hypothetical protein